MKPSKIFAAGLILILIVVHQDFWNWGVTERTIGGLPQGFVFQVGLSIAAAFTWLIVTMVAWPKDEWAETENNKEAQTKPAQANMPIEKSGAEA